MANNLYTTQVVTTSPIQMSGSGILDNPSFFPPTSGYRMEFKPKPGNQIQAAQFRHVKRFGTGNIIFDLSLQDHSNSHTKWPSRFEFTTPGFGATDLSTSSGRKEFEGFYKVVFEDSTNPTNDTTWDITSVGNSNKVYMWIYFGKNETTPMNSLANISIDIDVDYQPDAITLSETTVVFGSVVTNTINDINII